MRTLELSPSQLRVLASGVRSEIVRALSDGEAMSVREIADALGRPASGLYAHLEQLIEAGLVSARGKRATARRPQTLYALVSKRFSSRKARDTKAGRNAMAQAGRRVLASAARAVSDAFSADEAVYEGQGRNTFVRQMRIRLRPSDLAWLNSEIDALFERAVERSARSGARLEVTVAMSPRRLAPR